jgi:hypothetical protein
MGAKTSKETDEVVTSDIRDDIVYINDNIDRINFEINDIKGNINIINGDVKNLKNSSIDSEINLLKRDIDYIVTILSTFNDKLNSDNNDSLTIIDTIINKIINFNPDKPSQENFSNSKMINYLLITLIIIFIIILILFFP